MSNLSDFIFKDNIKGVQRLSATIAGGQTVVDVAISPVDTNKTIIIPAGRTGRSVFVQPVNQVEKGDFYDNGPADATIRLTSSTNVRLQRAAGNAVSGGGSQAVSMTYEFQVVEFT